ncbi:hypothetical protein AB0M39_14525 [Streptomyces sp. NPDC051907]
MDIGVDLGTANTLLRYARGQCVEAVEACSVCRRAPAGPAAELPGPAAYG